MGLEADCVRVVEDTIKEFGGLDIIVSNAVSRPASAASLLQSQPRHTYCSRPYLTLPPGLDSLLPHQRPYRHYSRRLGHLLRRQRQGAEFPPPNRPTDIQSKLRGWIVYHDIF